MVCLTLFAGRYILCTVKNCDRANHQPRYPTVLCFSQGCFCYFATRRISMEYMSITQAAEKWGIKGEYSINF